MTSSSNSVKVSADPSAKDRFAITQQFTKCGSSESRVTVVVEERKGVERRLVIPISYVGVGSTGKK